jgi:membrane protein involved in colicin uptake
MARLGLPETYDPRDLPVWQSRLAEAQKKQSELEAKKTRHGDASRAIEDAVKQLRSALGPSGEALELKALTRHARATVAETAKHKAEAHADKKRREEAKAEAERRANEVEAPLREVLGSRGQMGA